MPLTRHRVISASDLRRQRGWTETLIGALLGAPDAHCPNPHGWRSPMRLYREDRVLDAETHPDFVRRVEKLDEALRWRREQPSRALDPTTIEHLEWLDDPERIALFHLPRRPRMRVRRPPVEATTQVAYALPPFQVMQLFEL